MPKYMVEASYTVDGVKGLMQDGGSARVDAVRGMVEALGGSLESMYFTFGESDVIAIVDVPDNVAAATAAMTVGATGTVQTRTWVLLTAEEVDAASEKSVAFRPAGQ